MPVAAGALAKRTAPRQCPFWAVIAQIRDKVAIRHFDPSSNPPQMKLRSSPEVRGAEGRGQDNDAQNLFDLFAGRGGACSHPGGTGLRRDSKLTISTLHFSRTIEAPCSAPDVISSDQR